jgi:hypothetical protein
MDVPFRVIDQKFDRRRPDWCEHDTGDVTGSGVRTTLWIFVQVNSSNPGYETPLALRSPEVERLFSDSLVQPLFSFESAGSGQISAQQ